MIPLLGVVHLGQPQGAAVRGLSFSVGTGEVVILLGSNGAGKSTTMKAISGLVRPIAGTILLEGQPLEGLKPEAIVRLGVAHVPEGRRVFPGLTVRENIILGASNRSGLAKRDLRDNVEAMFDLFPDSRRFGDALGWTLSGGQLQMVALARGQMAKPRILLLDEPSLGLAPVIVQAVFAIIAEVRRRGTTVLLVEQNARMGLSVADRGYVLETGRLVLEGEPHTLWTNDEIRSAYLGGRTKPEIAVSRNAR
ncbi:ABC transporter ATP-binding protein [Methylobacterium sp. P5_C11]